MKLALQFFMLVSILLVGVLLGIDRAEKGIYQIDGKPEQASRAFHITKIDEGKIEIDVLGKRIVTDSQGNVIQQEQKNPDKLKNTAAERMGEQTKTDSADANHKGEQTTTDSAANGFSAQSKTEQKKTAKKGNESSKQENSSPRNWLSEIGNTLGTWVSHGAKRGMEWIIARIS